MTQVQTEPVAASPLEQLQAGWAQLVQALTHHGSNAATQVSSQVQVLGAEARAAASAAAEQIGRAHV